MNFEQILELPKLIGCSISIAYRLNRICLEGIHFKFHFFSCNGGVVEETVEWVANNRIVSGGNYSSRSFCMPYPFPPHRCVGMQI